MSKFQVGDKVRVVQVTDDEQDPPQTIKDPNHVLAKDWNEVPLIGLVGTVIEVWNQGLYTVGVVFEHMTEGESASFTDDDLELYKNPNIQLGVNFFD